MNIAAISTLRQVEAEDRRATPEEQEVLSRYVGWGGIAKAFDPDDSKWAKEYAELKELLTPEEYSSARSTVLNAHYTSPAIIRAIYQAIANMGCAGLCFCRWLCQGWTECRTRVCREYGFGK